MAGKDYSISFKLDETPEKIFEAINNVTKWWTENLKGKSKDLNDEFEVHFGNVHFSRHKLIEVVPYKRIGWLTTDSKLNFTDDKNEWNGTTITFDIAIEGAKAILTFTHHGLIPEVECFDACSNAWGDYISNSLVKLIRTGKGKPTMRDLE